MNDGFQENHLTQSDPLRSFAIAVVQGQVSEHSGQPVLLITDSSSAEAAAGNLGDDFRSSLPDILAMGRWESTASSPGKVGLHGVTERENSRQARLQHLLQGIGVKC